MLSKAVGFIAELTGDVTIRGTDGVTRVASLGDTVREGELVVTGLNSLVLVSFYNGNQLHVIADAAVMLDETVSFDSGSYDDAQVDQVLALQQAIIDGVDLADFEPTAAGLEGQDGNDGLQQSADFQRDGREGLVDTRLLPFERNDSTDQLDNFSNADDLLLNPVEDNLPTVNATIIVDPVTADDVVNAEEAAAIVDITGSVGGDAVPGDTVSVTINGTDYSTTVQADNTFSIPVSGADLAAGTSFDAIVTGSDTLGNPYTATTTSTYGVDIDATATITLDPITSDDIINASEAGRELEVGGSVSGDVADGDTVTLQIGDVFYVTTVLDGRYSVTVPAAAVANLNDGVAIGSVSGTDSAGNPFEATTSRPFTVDTEATAAITVDPVATDDIINATESGSDLEISGSVSGDATVGDTVTVTIGGTTYNSTVNADGTFYSVTVPAADVGALADGNITASVTGTDEVGNSFTANATRPFTVDDAASASVTINTIAGDDIVNAIESGSDLEISGSVLGDAAAGDVVAVTIGGTTYNSTVNADGTTYSVTVPAAAVGTLADGSVTASVTGTDEAGNSFTANATRPFTVNDATSASVTIDTIAGDDIINAIESGSDLEISGSVSGDATAGDVVAVTIGGTTYNSTVNADGTTYSVTVPAADVGTLADGSVTASVTGTDEAGNSFTANATRPFTVDDAASAGVTIDTIAGDDIINAIESGSDLEISGSVSGDAAAGDVVAVTIGGATYSSTVNADGTTYSVTLPAAAVGTLADGSVTASVTGTDEAGNSFTANATRPFTVDSSSAATVSIDDITADDVVNASEAGGNIDVTGTV
ncbi:retention module-containing protein, partial [Zhongshania aliphaticivorans]|uniref:retention module-containing protein n=1 Tax=Zhongshania aliphaticivorans TaxID=1470434 RepID=UPI00132FB563